MNRELCGDLRARARHRFLLKRLRQLGYGAEIKQTSEDDFELTVRWHWTNEMEQRHLPDLDAVPPHWTSPLVGMAKQQVEIRVRQLATRTAQLVAQLIGTPLLLPQSTCV